MMINPPIDKLIDKVGCKYALVITTAKRARHLIDKKSDMIDETKVNPVSLAAEEIYKGKVEARVED